MKTLKSYLLHEDPNIRGEAVLAKRTSCTLIRKHQNRKGFEGKFDINYLLRCNISLQLRRLQFYIIANIHIQFPSPYKNDALN